MVKGVLIGVFLFFAVIILAVRRKRAEQLDEVASKLGLNKGLKSGDAEIVDQILNRCFLYVKGAYYEIHKAYARTNPPHFMLDIKYSSPGNVDIGFQRVVLILKATPENVQPFVLENPDKLHRNVQSTDLMEAGFIKHKYTNQVTYVKCPDIDWYKSNFDALAQSLVNRYSDICLESHVGYFIVYLNRSNVNPKELGLFYKTIIEHLLSFIANE